MIPVDDEQTMSWSEIKKVKSAEPILESRKAKHWSEIVNENKAGNGRKDLKPSGTKEMQTMSWSEVAENATATTKGVKPMRRKESERLQRQGPLAADHERRGANVTKTSRISRFED